MKCLLILFCIILSSISFPFEKKLWTYWGTNIQNAPLLVKICAQKLQKAALKQNISFTLLSNENLHQYIPQYEQNFVSVVKASERASLQASSDLVRLAIIQHHGGIYMDISSILLNNFTLQWLGNLNNYEDFIINKYGQEPDVLLFTFGYYQNAFNDRNKGKLMNQYPGFQLWFIAAKKNSTLIKQYKQTYYNFTLWKFHQYNQYLSDHDYFIKNIDVKSSYWSVNIALSYLLQKKQRQFDANRTILDLFEPRKSVFQHYKLWGICGQLGPLIFTRAGVIRQVDILKKTQQQLLSSTGQLSFFIKMNGPVRQLVVSWLDNLNSAFILPNHTFNSFLSSSPSPSLCPKLKFITKDSLFDKEFIKVSKYGKYWEKAIISVDQRDKWEQYCQENEQGNYQRGGWGLQNYILKTDILTGGDFALIQNILNYKSSLKLTFIQQAQLVYETYRFVILNLLYFLFEIIAIIGLISLTIPIMKSILSKLIKINHNNNQLNFKKPQKSFNFYLIISCRIILLVYGRTLFYSIQYFCYFPPSQILIVIYLVLIILLQKAIKSHEQSIRQQKVGGLSLNNIIHLTQIPIVYFLAYALFFTIQKRAEYVLSHSILVGIIGTCIISIGEILMKATKANNLLVIMNSLNTYVKPIIMILLIILWLVPNLRFIYINQCYVITNLTYICIIYIFLLLAGVLYELWTHVTNTKLKVFSSYRLFLLKTLLILIMISIFISYLCVYAILKYQIWYRKALNFSLVTGYTYLYMLTKRNTNHCNKNHLINEQQFNLLQINQTKQKNQYEQETNFQQKHFNLEIFLLYGFMFSYLIFGSLLALTKFQELSSYIQLYIFMINIVVLIAWQSLHTKQIISQDQNHNNQLSQAKLYSQ